MIWLVLIWTALIVLWVNAERFAPAAKFRHLWQHAAAPIARATQHEAKQPPPKEGGSAPGSGGPSGSPHH